MRTPVYYVKDVETAKNILIKDFAHFQDHNDAIASNFDDIFSNALVMMKGKRWREMRISLTPAFTGTKMRLMLELINTCCQQIIDHITSDIKNSKETAFDAKVGFAKYTNDVIATCAFGVECNSFKDPNNEIYYIGKEFAEFQKPLRVLKLLFVVFFPKISKLLGLKLFSEKKMKRFREIIIETMETREKYGIIRPDMINILMELKKSTEKETEGKRTWTEMELMAQSFQFFSAGSDPSSTLMSFIAYELATNPDIQEKLIQEIDETHESLNGQSLTYEALQHMKYLHMIISEVMRKWPPAVVTDRICVQDYQYEDDLGHKLTIEKGSLIWIPIFAFQRDPKIYPNPDNFYPERFSEENNPNMDAFLGFGSGPRSCIGVRFALMETKAVFYHILRNFRIKVGKETQVPLKLKKSLVGLFPEKPIKVYFEPRHNRE